MNNGSPKFTIQMGSRLHERRSIMLLIICTSLAAMADAAAVPSFLSDLPEPDLSSLQAAIPNPRPVGQVVNTKPQTLDLDEGWTVILEDNDDDNFLNSLTLPDFKPTTTPFENAYLTSETNMFKSKDDFNIDYFVKYNKSDMMSAQSCAESGLKLPNGGVTTFCLLGTDTATDFASQLMDPCKDAGLDCVPKSTTLVKADTIGICHKFEETATEESNAFPVKSDWGKDCRYIIYHPDCVTISGVPSKWEYDDKVKFSKDSVVMREFRCKKDYTKHKNEVLTAKCDRHGKTVFSKDLCKVDFGMKPQIGNFNIGGFGGNINVGGPTDLGTDGSTEQGTDESINQSTEGTGGGSASIEKLNGGLAFDFKQFKTRVVTTTQFPYFKCPPNTINLETNENTNKTFFWNNNYCHVYSDNVNGYDKPTIVCKGTNYNSYDESGMIEDYKSEKFDRDLTDEELRVKKCGLQCTMIAVEFVKKMSTFVDFDEEDMADLSCYYYNNLATTLFYYNFEFFKWVDIFLGGQTSP